jgi:hypothetical protein
MKPSGGRAGRQGWWSEIAITRSGCFWGQKARRLGPNRPIAGHTPESVEEPPQRTQHAEGRYAGTLPPGNLRRLLLRQCAAEGMTPQFSAENIALAQYPKNTHERLVPAPPNSATTCKSTARLSSTLHSPLKSSQLRTSHHCHYWTRLDFIHSN